MRQVQRPPARVRKPSLSAGPAHPTVRPVVQAWLERLDPSTDPLAAPGQPDPPAKEVNPMATLRQVLARLLLVAGPTALLLLETAGLRIPP
jgi:hypothetical protein